MALIKCPECKKEISNSAEACPQCGYKITEEDKQAALKLQVTALIKCPECKKEISNSVEACPQCGYKIKEEDRQATLKPRTWGSICLFWGSAIVLSFSTTMIAISSPEVGFILPYSFEVGLLLPYSFAFSLGLICIALYSYFRKNTNWKRLCLFWLGVYFLSFQTSYYGIVLNVGLVRAYAVALILGLPCTALYLYFRKRTNR